MNRKLVFLEGLNPFADFGLLLLRMLTGIFLVYGVLDNVLSAERMDEFVKFLQANQFAAPEIRAPLSVYTQFFCGPALVLGLLTRWAGLILAINFVVAVLLVHWSQDFRGWWPAIVLVGIGLQFALTGAGGVSLDAVILRRGESKK
jgi:putative oxidoreductase